LHGKSGERTSWSWEVVRYVSCGPAVACALPGLLPNLPPKIVSFPKILTKSWQVAAGRILNCLNADAAVTVVCPAEGLNAEVGHRVATGQVQHRPRVFEPADLDDADMVLVAVDDPAASTAIWKLCKERRIPANIADVPPECDFFFGSVHRDGPLQIMVSTNGKGPRLASSIRKFIAAQLPTNAGSAIEAIGSLRAKLRVVSPNPEDGPRRMGW
jgi:precorrin-2 dehydrogenase / sirohydrochlorin ferrochelatase